MTEQELSALFAYNLNRILSEKNLKQADIIRALDIGKATVSDWCAGRNVPRTPMFSALISFLGAKASDFFREKEPAPNDEGGFASADEVARIAEAYSDADSGTKRSVRKLLDIVDERPTIELVARDNNRVDHLSGELNRNEIDAAISETPSET